MQQPSRALSGYVGYVMVMITMVLWSAFALVSRYITSVTELNSWDLCFLRFATGTLVLLPFAIYFKWHRLFSQPKIWLLAVLGGVGFASTAFIGLSSAPASHAGIWMHGMMPVFAMLATRLLTNEQLNRSSILSIFTIVVGIVLMNVAMKWQQRFSFSLGDLFYALAALSWATYSVLLRKWHMPVVSTTAGVTVISAIMYIPVYVLCFDHTVLWNTSWTIILSQSMFHGVVIVILAMFAYLEGIKRLGVIKAGVLLSFSPLLTSVLAVFLLKETLYLETWIGIVTVSIAALQPWRLIKTFK